MKKQINLLIVICITLTQQLSFGQNDTTNDSWRIEPATSTLYTNELVNGVQRIAIGNNYTNTDLELFASSPEQGFRVHSGRIGFNDCNFWPQYLKYERTGGSSCIGNLEFWTKHGALDESTSYSVKMMLTAYGTLGINTENPSYSHKLHAVGKPWSGTCTTTLSGLKPAILARGGISFGAAYNDNSGSWIGTYNDTNGNGYLDSTDSTTLRNSSTIGFYIPYSFGCVPNGEPSIVIDGTEGKRGFMGINMVSPQHHLDVNGTGRFKKLLVENDILAIDGTNGTDAAIELFYDPQDNAPHLSFGFSNSQQKMMMDEAGVIVIGTIDPSSISGSYPGAQLYLAGNGVVDGTMDVTSDAYKHIGGGFWTVTSDKRLKTNIQKIDNSALNKIDNVDVVSFEYKNVKGKKQMGIIAQDIAEIFPNSVGKRIIDGEERLTFNPNDLFYTLVKAFQELSEIVNQNSDGIDLINNELVVQQTQIENLQEENKEVKAENEELKNEIKILRQQVQNQENRLTKIETMLQRLGENNTTEIMNQMAISDSDQNIKNNLPTLLQNYPNPFFGETSIIYSLPEKTRSARIQVYNLDGQLVKIFDLPLKPGQATLSLNKRNFNVSVGAYVYNLVVNDASIDSKQMVITK